MTKRLPGPQIEKIGIPQTGEVRAAVLGVFDKFRDESVNVVANYCEHRADDYEEFAYNILNERLAPPLPQTEVARQICNLGRAANALVRAMVETQGEASKAIREAARLLPNMPDNSWYDTGELLGRSQGERGPPSVDEMDLIVTRFAKLAREGTIGDDPLYSRSQSAKPLTHSSLEKAVLHLAVLAEIASENASSEAAGRINPDEIAKMAAADFQQITGRPPTRSEKGRNTFPDFLSDIFVACRLNRLGIKSSSYSQTAVNSVRPA